MDPSLYLDHSATTPPRPEAIAAMQVAMMEQWGNPSSLHPWGERSAMAMEKARMQVADLLGADPARIVFTSGGTESNNLALFGLAHRAERPGHLIISSVEHSSVETVATRLMSSGWRITRLPVTNEGSVTVQSLEAALEPDTVAVSILHGQNEVGVVQPIQELAQVCRSRGILFHCDCVQTAGRLPLAVEDLQVDLLSLSSHKLYGPQGAGALYITPGLDLAPLLHGGGQEGGLRSGTQPVPAIVGFGVAAELAQQEMSAEIPRLRSLQRYLYQQLLDLPQMSLIGPQDLAHRLPHHLSYCVRGTTGTALVQRLSQAGIAISAGSACKRGKLAPSPALVAMGIPPELTLGAIRLTLGKATTQAALAYTAQTLRTLITAASMAEV